MNKKDKILLLFCEFAELYHIPYRILNMTKNIYGSEYKSHVKLCGWGPENYLQKSTLRSSGKNRSNFPCGLWFFSFIINILVTLMFVCS